MEHNLGATITAQPNSWGIVQVGSAGSASNQLACFPLIGWQSKIRKSEDDDVIAEYEPVFLTGIWGGEGISTGDSLVAIIVGRTLIKEWTSEERSFTLHYAPVTMEEAVQCYLDLFKDKKR